jgi:hypothetical protein
MGRSRNNGSISYDVTVTREQFEALEARASEQDSTVEEIVRADLLSESNKERLVPRARKMVRHAKINVTFNDPESAGLYTLPSLEPGLDD